MCYNSAIFFFWLEVKHSIVCIRRPTTQKTRSPTWRAISCNKCCFSIRINFKWLNSDLPASVPNNVNCVSRYWGAQTVYRWELVNSQNAHTTARQQTLLILSMPYLWFPVYALAKANEMMILQFASLESSWSKSAPRQNCLQSCADYCLCQLWWECFEALSLFFGSFSKATLSYKSTESDLAYGSKISAKKKVSVSLTNSRP